VEPISGGNPLPGTRVRIIDVYDQNNVLDELPFDGSSNYLEFNISIADFTFAGIHKIDIRFYNPTDQPYSTINSTFIVINETVTFNSDPYLSLNPKVIQRNDGGFYVTGKVVNNNEGMRGLQVKLLLFDKNYKNVSQYLIGGNVYDLTDSNGNFRFDINSISIDCQYGPYYIRVDFNGSIQLLEIPGIDLIPHFMINASSNYVDINVTATTYITQINHFTDYQSLSPDKWIYNDILHVIGDLFWDNSSGIV